MSFEEHDEVFYDTRVNMELDCQRPYSTKFPITPPATSSTTSTAELLPNDVYNRMAMSCEQMSKGVSYTLLLVYLSSFVLMVTSICTSSWYTTHPLAPTEQTSYGSLGLIEHCSTLKGVCKEREGILKFSDECWPYRPLKSDVFDVTLLLLIISMTCTITAPGITLLLRLETFHRKQWLTWLLLVISLKSAVLGISGVWYLDTHVRSEQFRQGWSSYVAWLSVGLSTLVNIPLVYLIRLKPTKSDNIKSSGYTKDHLKVNEFTTAIAKENHYIVSTNKQGCPYQQRHFHYVDMHDVE